LLFGVCRPIVSHDMRTGCAMPSPAGCKMSGCPTGQRCVETAPIAGPGYYECLASGCWCSAGQWLCSLDCEGGRCVAEGSEMAQ
jgi:hypothetical protein